MPGHKHSNCLSTCSCNKSSKAVAIHERRVHVLFQAQNSAAWQEGLDKWMLKTAVRMARFISGRGLGAGDAGAARKNARALRPSHPFASIGSVVRREGLALAMAPPVSRKAAIVKALGVHGRIKKCNVLDSGGQWAGMITHKEVI